MTPFVALAELLPASVQVPMDTDCEEKDTANSKVKSGGKPYGKILPILLPDFLKVKKKIEENGATKCEECRAEFDTTAELINHMKKHTGGDVYKCDECPSVFTTKESLRRHAKKHTQNNPTECTICNTVFQSPDSCTAHMRTHYGKKAHACEHCNKVRALSELAQFLILSSVPFRILNAVESVWLKTECRFRSAFSNSTADRMGKLAS